MRAPDGHDGGDGGSGDAGAGDDAGAAGAGADDAGKSGEGADGDGDSEGTALGDADAEADADDGAGGADKDGEGDGKGGKDDEADADGPPEAYDLKLTRTEKNDKDEEVVTDMPLDPVLVEKATPILKSLNLTNDQANELIKVVPDIHARFVEQQANDFAATRAEWAKTAKADAEIGGKNWTPSLNAAAKALDHFGAIKGSPFRTLLDETGLGNHPEMVRVFSKMGKMIAEDQELVRGDAGGVQKRDKLAENYPNDVPEAVNKK